MKREEKIRMWVARLYQASGCSCCRDDAMWYRASVELGKLLDIPEYKDGSGHDFYAVAENYKDEPIA